MTSVNSKGISINYNVSGEGEPLILLMGLGAYGNKWLPHVKVYEKYFQCICIDNRGSGLSDKPEMDFYTTDMMAEDVIHVMDHLNIEKAHFHGISMGGAIAQKIAIHYPERIQALVLTSTFSYPEEYFKRALEILKNTVGVIDGSIFSHLVQYMIYSADYFEDHLNEILEAEEQDANDPIKMPAYAYIAQCEACLRHNTLDELHKIKAPTLIAAGNCDLFVSATATMELFHNIPNVSLYLCKNGGHVHHWEKLNEFNKITLEFMLKNRMESEIEYE